jgi:acyl-CoA hydrolase
MLFFIYLFGSPLTLQICEQLYNRPVYNGIVNYLKPEKKMEVITYITQHLVKSEDLNHHGTLYAGRTAEWFVESGFIAAASLTHPENIVCLKIHGMSFTRPVKRGELVAFYSKIVHTGKSRLVSHIKVVANGQEVVEGFITFVHVDLEGHALPHGLTIEATTQEDIDLQQKAKQLPV